MARAVEPGGAGLLGRREEAVLREPMGLVVVAGVRDGTVHQEPSADRVA